MGTTRRSLQKPRTSVQTYRETQAISISRINTMQRGHDHLSSANIGIGDGLWCCKKRIENRRKPGRMGVIS
eukprot:scaffold5247_cov130-Cylindrotheca_fusiformis.AAC.4